jgi:hypothetical protein
MAVQGIASCKFPDATGVVRLNGVDVSDLSSNPHFPDMILRQKAGTWEEIDEHFFRLFRNGEPLERAIQVRIDLGRQDERRQVVTVGEYIFIWLN